jgi:DNA repair photolyase
MIPGLREQEVPAIVEACARAGAQVPRHILPRLPHAVAPLFEDWLDCHFPERKKKLRSRLPAVRDGRVNDPRFHSRMSGSGVFAEQIHAKFFRQANEPQLSLFMSES